MMSQLRQETLAKKVIIGFVNEKESEYGTS